VEHLFGEQEVMSLSACGECEVARGDQISPSRPFQNGPPYSGIKLRDRPVSITLGWVSNSTESVLQASCAFTGLLRGEVRT